MDQRNQHTNPLFPRITIRGVAPMTWRRLRAEATKRGLPVGVLLNEIVRKWLESAKDQPHII